jgi:hypothetical protein
MMMFNIRTVPRRTPGFAWALAGLFLLALPLSVGAAFVEEGCMSHIEENGPFGPPQLYHGGDGPFPEECNQHACYFDEETQTAEREYDAYHSNWQPGSLEGHDHDQVGEDCTIY